jgi:hypothetical protein
MPEKRCKGLQATDGLELGLRFCYNVLLCAGWVGNVHYQRAGCHQHLPEIFGWAALPAADVELPLRLLIRCVAVPHLLGVPLFFII